MVEFKLDKTLGYMYALMQDHPCADVNGKLYEHRYVMYNHIGRNFYDDECVHHKDRDKTNNKLSNLQLMTKSEHIKLHMLEDRNGMVIITDCIYCNKQFEHVKSDPRKFCSALCASSNTRKFNVSKEDLEKMVWEMPTTKVAKIFGVSDKAIDRRCKVLGIAKPPRGYWAKQYSNKV